MSNYGQFTEEQKDWITNHIKGKYYKDVVKEFNEKFGTELKIATFRHRCIRDGFRENGKVGGILDFTEEQDKWLRLNTYRGWEVVVKEFNELFGTDYGRDKLRRHCERFLKHKSGIERKTYQKQMPLYSKRYNSKDDCIEIKICDEIGKCKWVAEHIFICEQAYGKLPKNSKIIHLNGNRTDNRLENLYVTSNSIMIAAHKTYNWENKEPIYRLCALKNSELKLLLDERK